MSLTAFACGSNVVGYKKDGVNFAMTCAWAQMVDYDKLTMLLGSQSDTGKHIKKGDIIGVNSLSSSQNDISLKLGENHSLSIDKLKGINYSYDDTAIMIEGAKVNMKCEVIDVIHLEGIEEDNFLYLKVLKYNDNEDKEFLLFKH